MIEKKVNDRKKIELPTLTIVLMLIFGIIGLLMYNNVYGIAKRCTAKVEGFVDFEHHAGGFGEKWNTVAGKYLRVGKDGRHWITIHVNTDECFKYNILYAESSYGRKGERLKIYYNPNDMDEYYIKDYRMLDEYVIAVTFFVLAGIMLVLSIVFTFWLNKKPKSKEEKYKKKANNIKKIEKRADRISKKFNKVYTNPYIREQFQSKNFDVKLVIVILLFGITFCSFGFVLTYIDIHRDRQIPFNNFPHKLDNSAYSVVIKEDLSKLSTLEKYGDYYDISVGNEHILALHINKNDISAAAESVKLRGKLKRINSNSKELRIAITDYYENTGYLDTLKDKEYIYYYLDCSKISFWEEFKDNHIGWFLFGMTFIVVAILFSNSILHLIWFYRPLCSDRQYKAEEIDKLANDTETLWLKDLEVLLTPCALIGLNHGMKVVDYCDIYKVKVEENKHISKSTRTWTTYRIVIETKKHRNILLTESEKNRCSMLLNFLDYKAVKYEV